MRLTFKFPIQKVIFFYLFPYFLMGCSGPSAGWQCEVIKEPYCAVLFLPAKNKFRHIEIEIQKTADDFLMYLTVYGIPFATENDGTVPLSITIGDNIAIYKAKVLEGNHRIHVPLDVKNMLFSAFEEHLKVAISVGRYATELNYENYDMAIKKFKMSSQKRSIILDSVFQNG